MRHTLPATDKNVHSSRHACQIYAEVGLLTAVGSDEGTIESYTKVKAGIRNFLNAVFEG